MKNTLVYLAHYFRGAGAATFNAGCVAVSAALGKGAAVILGAKIPLPTAAETWAIFYGAAVVAFFMFVTNNPLPVIVPEAPRTGPKSPAEVAAGIVALLVACFCLTGCVGVDKGVADMKKTIAALPVGSFDKIDLGHHDVYGNGGIVLKNGEKTSDGAGHIELIRWEENYPVYQPHFEVDNFRWQGSAPKPAAPVTTEPTPAK